MSPTLVCLSLLLSSSWAIPSKRDGISSCRPLPEDVSWPSNSEWTQLNDTLGGRLIRGRPLASPCFGSERSERECDAILGNWTQLDPRLAHPIEVMSPYWTNNSCSPFLQNGTCVLGNLASYAINVSSADDVVAGLQFVRNHNVRLTIKNTGHDFLGRSTGAGALALWTHNLKDLEFMDYDNHNYSGPAVRIGAGVQGGEVLQAAYKQGLRVTIGDCPTVGVAGGWAQGGGHGHLGPKYGLGADNILEYEVVTTDGQLKTVSPIENEDLYWALSGGGAGTYAIVMSMTIKAYPDGQVAGARLAFYNTNATIFWSAVEAWFRHVLVLDAVPGMSAIANMNNDYFGLDFVTLPDADATALAAYLAPFSEELDRLNVSIAYEEIRTDPSYYEHYEHFATFAYDTNNTLGSRLISRSLLEDQLSEVVSSIEDIVTQSSVGVALLGGNYTHLRVGNQPGSNAVLPAWRDSAISVNFFLELAQDASWDVISSHQELVNKWQDQVKALSPEAGAYISEATYDNPDWKKDYFGSNYDDLLAVKNKYDPEHVLWQNTAVGNDQIWMLSPEGRLCPMSTS